MKQWAGQNRKRREREER